MTAIPRILNLIKLITIGKKSVDKDQWPKL